MAADVIFHYLVVLGAAEEDADAGVFGGAFAIAVECPQVEGQLARVFRFKAAGFQLKRREALQVVGYSGLLPPNTAECRRSMQLDLACDIFGGFSRNFCQLGIAGPIGHGPFYLRQNLRRVFYPMLFAQCLKLGRAGIPSLAHDEHALLAARAIGKDQVVGGCKNPLVSSVQKE